MSLHYYTCLYNFFRASTCFFYSLMYLCTSVNCFVASRLFYVKVNLNLLTNRKQEEKEKKHSQKHMRPDTTTFVFIYVCLYKHVRMVSDNSCSLMGAFFCSVLFIKHLVSNLTYFRTSDDECIVSLYKLVSGMKTLH